jgi:hypothetical protein
MALHQKTSGAKGKGVASKQSSKKQGFQEPPNEPYDPRVNPLPTIPTIPGLPLYPEHQSTPVQPTRQTGRASVAGNAPRGPRETAPSRAPPPELTPGQHTQSHRRQTTQHQGQTQTQDPSNTQRTINIPDIPPWTREEPTIPLDTLEAIDDQNVTQRKTRRRTRNKYSSVATTSIMGENEEDRTARWAQEIQLPDPSNQQREHPSYAEDQQYHSLPDVTQVTDEDIYKAVNQLSRDDKNKLKAALGLVEISKKMDREIERKKEYHSDQRSVSPSQHGGFEKGYPYRPGGGPSSHGSGSNDSYPRGNPRGPPRPRRNDGVKKRLFAQIPAMPVQADLKIKVKEPDTFDGTTSRLEDWIRQMDTYFLLQSATFKTEEAKVLTAYHHVRDGTAGEWAAYHTKEYLKARNGESYFNSDVYWTWTELKEAMKIRFGDRYEKETAQKHITKARQGNKKIAQYIDNFVHWIPKAELPQDQLCKYFQGGVNNDLWEMVKSEPLPKDDLHALMEIFERAERNHVDRELTMQQRQVQQRINQLQSSSGSWQAKPSSNKQTAGRSGPSRQPQRTQNNPGSNSRKPNPPSHKKPTDGSANIDQTKQNRSATIKCYKCGKLGHISRECTVRDIKELSQDHINEIVAARLAADDPEEEAEESQSFDIENPYRTTVEDVQDESEEEDFY